MKDSSSLSRARNAAVETITQHKYIILKDSVVDAPGAHVLVVDAPGDNHDTRNNSISFSNKALKQSAMLKQCQLYSIYFKIRTRTAHKETP